MQKINRYECNSCDFHMPSGWGSRVYAVNEEGDRVICPHPGEWRHVRDVTGLYIYDAITRGKVGSLHPCVCTNCLHQFELDFKNDEQACPECSSPSIRSELELVGEVCPQCGVGEFTQVNTGVTC